MEQQTDAITALEYMRRNDQDPKLREFALERAGKEFAGYYHGATERLLEQGVRGQAIMAALNTMRESLPERPGKDRFIAAARAKDEDFDERRATLESQLADQGQTS